LIKPAKDHLTIKGGCSIDNHPLLLGTVAILSTGMERVPVPYCGTSWHLKAVLLLNAHHKLAMDHLFTLRYIACASGQKITCMFLFVEYVLLFYVVNFKQYCT